MNALLNSLKNETNYTLTENGAVTHKTTRSDLLDMFAMGGAMRKRSDEDVILMFQKAYAENPVYALKCLFYLRDVRGGQGERRFFRVAMKSLASKDVKAASRNLALIPEYGRWDDLYIFVGTPLENEMFNLIKHQLALDVECKTPSLLAKWMKSINTSSQESRELGEKTRRALGMTRKQYRKTLAVLRERINLLERLMSEGRWDEIEFDKIPSRAGMIYKNAFARHDLERMKSDKDVQSYEDFAKDTTTKVNAKALYPYECVAEASKAFDYWWNRQPKMDATQRAMVNKYWDNLADYFNGASLNALAVVDTSGSMTGSEASAPINVAISLGMYCAEKAHGPFAGHYISFASRPQLIAVEGTDFVDKVQRIYETNLCDNTNIEGVFSLLLDTAVNGGLKQSDMPQSIIIISDMEFDQASCCGYRAKFRSFNKSNAETLLEGIAKEWAAYGYEMPHLIFWNVQSRQNNIPMIGQGRISYVSGFSPSIFESIMSGKSGYDLMMETLNKERYAAVK